MTSDFNFELLDLLVFLNFKSPSVLTAGIGGGGGGDLEKSLMSGNGGGGGGGGGGVLDSLIASIAGFCSIDSLGEVIKAGSGGAGGGLGVGFGLNSTAASKLDDKELTESVCGCFTSTEASNSLLL